MATVPWIAILIILLLVLNIMSWGLWFALPLLVIAGLANYMLFERIVVHERCGFRCKTCGYDLQGQVEPYCPECGRAFDDEEIEQMKLISPGEVRMTMGISRARRWAAILIILFLALAVLGQLVHLWYLRKSQSRPPQPAAPAQTSASPVAEGQEQ